MWLQAARRCPAFGAPAPAPDMARKSSIERLPEAVKQAIDDHLAANRLTLDEVLDQIHAQYGEENTPSRSALGRRKQRMDAVLAKHRQTNAVMGALLRHVDTSDGSSVSRGVIEMMRMAAFEVAEEISAEETPDVGALSALALAMKRLAGAEDLTLKARERIAREQREADAEAAETAAIEMGLTADRAAQLRQRVLYGQV